METKKSAKANLEKRKIYFLEIGLILALGLCFAAFEWSEPEIGDNQINFNTGYLEFDSDIEPPIQINPPEYQKPKVIPDILTVVDDDVIVDTAVDVVIPGDDLPFDFDFGEQLEKLEIPEEETEPIPEGLVPHKPIFPGGDAALLKFISENTKYPALAKENNVFGKVFVYFVVGIDGRVGSVGIAKGVNPDLDKEAVRVISMLPAWTPGRKGEKPVPVSFIIPINFKLN
jgi:periplasmic protein TonB